MWRGRPCTRARWECCAPSDGRWHPQAEAGGWFSALATWGRSAWRVTGTPATTPACWGPPGSEGCSLCWGVTWWWLWSWLRKERVAIIFDSRLFFVLVKTEVFQIFPYSYEGKGREERGNHSPYFMFFICSDEDWRRLVQDWFSLCIYKVEGKERFSTSPLNQVKQNGIC